MREVISHYKIFEKLGAGGMGVVYKAEDLKLKRLVALKFLPTELTHDAEAKERFIQEAQAASALDHPNICTIHEIDETDDGQMFIVMAYYEGETLQKKVSPAAAGLSVASAVEFAIQIAQGLAKTHEHGIVHRDLKPANVIITKDGVVKIVDFGLAKLASQPRLTKTGSTMGTMAYMSPEQARGEAVDHRTDIWALGVVLYEMLTGQLPFKGEQEHAMMYAVLNTTPKTLQELRADTPLALEQIVDRALTKSAAKRYQSMSDMLAALKALKQEIELGNVKASLLLAKLRRKKRAVQYAAFVLLLVAFTGIGLYLNQRLQQGPKIHSIAVLPLANLSGEANQEFFADGMTEALISVLGQIEALRVISRTSVMQYKGGTKPLPVIAQELNVDAVVEGSALSSGNRVSIAVRLIEAKTEKRLWSQNFERELRDVLNLQREMALAITNEIESKVTRQEQARLKKVRTVDPEAYKHYLWGLHFHEREYAKGYQQAVNHLEQAIKIDPTFAEAYAALAVPYFILGAIGLMPSAEARDKARYVAAKAVELDGSLSEAHTARAVILYIYDEDYTGAEEGFRQAIKLNPNSGEAHREYGIFLSRRGSVEEGLAEAIRAVELDPLSGTANGTLVGSYIVNRQYDKAIEYALTVLQLNPDFNLVQFHLGQAYLMKGLYEKAIAIFESDAMVKFDNLEVLVYLTCAYALSGKRDKALNLLNEFQRRLEPGTGPATHIAKIYVCQGEKDRALDILEQEQRLASLVELLHPIFDPLRAEPRFQGLLKKME